MSHSRTSGELVPMNGNSSVAGHLAFNAAERVVAKFVLRPGEFAARCGVSELRDSGDWHSNRRIAKRALAQGMQWGYVNWYEHQAVFAQLRDVRRQLNDGRRQ